MRSGKGKWRRLKRKENEDEEDEKEEDEKEEEEEDQNEEGRRILSKPISVQYKENGMKRSLLLTSVPPSSFLPF